MRVAVVALVLMLVLGVSLAVSPVYGKPAESVDHSKSKFVPDGYVDVIIYGGPAASQEKGVGIMAVKEKTIAAKVKEAEPNAVVLEEYKILGGVHAHIPAESVDKLRAQGYNVEENSVVHILLDSSGPVVNADKARRSYLNGNGTKVCILDTGIDFSHTQLQIPPWGRISDFVKRLDGAEPPSSNGTIENFRVYVNQSLPTLNFSINWINNGNRFDFYVWYPNGTYAGGTNMSTNYSNGGFWWMTLNLTGAPAGFYNITVNSTVVVNSANNEYYSVFWDPSYPQAGVYPYDNNGHGTHVAGIVTSNNSVYQGIAQGVTLYVGIICNNRGDCQSDEVVAGMDWCANQSADIMSLSIGGPDNTGNCSGSMAVKADVAADILLPVIAVGNSGPNAGSVASPGCARRTVGVGNVYDNGLISSDSGRGLTGDGRIKPDVVAPGHDITSTYPVNRFTSLSGTSMATPHVSGVAAIAKQANPTWTTPLLKAALMATANKANNGPHLDNTYGAGLIDAMQLVTKPYVNATTIHRGDSFAAYGRWLSAENNYTVQTISNNTNFTMNITVPLGTVSIKSVLYWEESSTDTRSQMSLYLFDPSGNLADNSSIINSTAQMVYNSTPMAGQWKLNVSGDNVQGTKTFVLFTSIRINSTTYALAEVNATGTLQNFTAAPDFDRANYTSVTNSSWFLGAHQIKFYSNDTLNNWGVSETATITVFSWAGINESANPLSARQNNNFLAYCRVRDSNTTAPIVGYNVSFWANDTSLGTGVTNNTGWANVTASLSQAGTYVIKCNITGNAAIYYDVAQASNSTLLTTNDTAAPQYSNLANTSAVYSADWQGNATWTDNIAVAAVMFESNFTGAYHNYSAANSSSIYYFTVSAGNFTGGQVVGYRWIANDSSGNTNSTGQQFFTIGKGPTLVRLFLNGTEGNRTYVRGLAANLTATVNVSGKNVLLAANFTNFSVAENSTVTATNITNLTGLDITEYNITAYFVADQNYSANSVTYFLKLLKADGESCSANNECYNGVCCSGSCMSSCPSAAPSGGGGGSVSAGTVTKLVRVEVDLTGRLQYADEYRIEAFPPSSVAYYYFSGLNHTITATGFSGTTITLSIASAPYNITIAVGETKKVDLDGDGNGDLAITLNSLTGEYADITFAKVPVTRSAEVPPPTNVTLPKNATQAVVPEERPQVTPVIEALFGVFGAAVVIFAFLKLRKKQKRRR
jgi:subtilisin family serine protease